MATPRRDTRRGPAVGVLATLAAAVCMAAPTAAVAATDPAGSAPPAAPSIPLPTTSAAAPPPSTSSRPTSVRAGTTSAAPAASATHRVVPTRATYPTYRSSVVPPASGYALSGIPTSAPTQTFVLGSGSIGSLPSTPAAVGTTPAATSHRDDSTDRDIRIFFTVVAVAALLFVAGIVGLVLTRDSRGRHR